MNSRGVMFTAVIFLMALSILSLNTVIRESRAKEQQFTTPAKVLWTSSVYENIVDSVIELKKSDEAVELEQGGLPFNYSFDENSLSISTDLPLKNADIENYFDMLSLAEVLLEDRDYGNIYSGLRVDVNTVKNSDWGGTASEFSFLTEPFCYELLLGQNDINFRESKSSKCIQLFDSSNIKRIDLNIGIEQATEDFNSLECTPAPCPQQAFDPASDEPFFSLSISDSNCINCLLDQNTVSMHFDPSSAQSIVLSCTGAACSSPSVNIALGGGISVQRESSRIGISLKHIFSRELESFKIMDFNIKVSTFDGKVARSNSPEPVS